MAKNNVPNSPTDDNINNQLVPGSIPPLARTLSDDFLRSTLENPIPKTGLDSNSAFLAFHISSLLENCPPIALRASVFSRTFSV